MRRLLSARTSRTVAVYKRGMKGLHRVPRACLVDTPLVRAYLQLVTHCLVYDWCVPSTVLRVVPIDNFIKLCLVVVGAVDYLHGHGYFNIDTRVVTCIASACSRVCTKCLYIIS